MVTGNQRSIQKKESLVSKDPILVLVVGQSGVCTVIVLFLITTQITLNQEKGREEKGTGNLTNILQTQKLFQYQGIIAVVVVLLRKKEHV